MKNKPLTDLLPSLVAAGIITTVFSASSATNMIHRYSFNEPVGSTTVTDSIRGSNGVVRSTPTGTLPTFDGSQVTLDGVGGYIDLPNRMLSGLTNVTFEFWTTYASGGTWSRILDFGIAAAGEDTNGTLVVGTPASNYVFMCFEPGPRFAITPLSNGNENQVNSGTAVAPGSVEHHFVVTYGPARTPSMYLDGNFVGSGNFVTPLSAITNDVNC
ncbi:MAG TPA: LamG-like jellyroll fold domain-containing protein, partial [Verrucomicrobiae bacterium]|nr:LamG-like jellyroll fold domain-containing protein [Verrucomicrobiae bacterium]